jgi:exopolysaccharide biosynthesis glucuronosyltransferase PssE
LGKPAMILVMVGTHFRGFDRLVRKMDEIAEGLDEKMMMQIGSGDYEPRNSEYFRHIGYTEMKVLIKDARVVVCHAGSGSVLDCVSSGKLPIVVPRLARFGEARDDHQLELAKFLDEAGSAIVVTDTERLQVTIRDYGSEQNNILKKKKSEGRGDRGVLAKVLREFIDGLSKSDARRFPYP